MDKDKIVSIDFLKINYSRNKFCKCYDSYPKRKPSFEIDYKNRIVECNYCHIIVDPFEALYLIAKYAEDINEEIRKAKEYKKELMNYRTFLRGIKSLEVNIRNGKMLPLCPRCKKAFDINNITEFVNKDYYRE